MFCNPGSIDSIFEKISPDDFDSKAFSRLYSAVISQYRASGIIDARKLIDSVQDSEFISLITEVASTDWEPAKIEEETRKFVRLFVDEKLKRIRSRLYKELAAAEAVGNSEQADKILTEIRSYGLDAKKSQN